MVCRDFGVECLLPGKYAERFHEFIAHAKSLDGCFGRQLVHFVVEIANQLEKSQQIFQSIFGIGITWAIGTGSVFGTFPEIAQSGVDFSVVFVRQQLPETFRRRLSSTRSDLADHREDGRFSRYPSSVAL